MPLKIDQNNKVKGLCKLTIDDDMTIYTINEMKNALGDQIELYEKFDLDLSGVIEIDTAGIQLLLALRSELKSKDKELKISSSSTVVDKLLKSFSINHLLHTGGNV